MKRKLLIVCAFAGMGTLATAQTTMVKNDRGEIVTPEAGDWAIGADASPILNYIGNMFNGTAGNSISNDFIGNPTQFRIFGKMFKDENTAYRATLGLRSGSSKVATLTDTSSTTTPSYYEDVKKTSGLSLNLSVGLEKRRGHGRLQGYYGGEFGIGVGGAASTITNTYGLDLSNSNPVDRILKSKSGTTINVGIRGFVGVEYFVLPKLSLGAEFGLGLGFTRTGEGKEDHEVWNGTGVDTYTLNTGKTSNFSFNTDNFSGAFRILYHF